MNMRDRDRIRYLLTLLKAENVSEQDRQSAYEQLADSTEALLLAYEDMKDHAGGRIVMTNPMDRLLDAVEWRELPAPPENDQDGPYATHMGTLDIGGITLRCYVLNTGQRLIDADDIHKFLGL